METKKRGGAGFGQGRKAKDGATKVKPMSICLTDEEKEKLKALGGSAWVREKLRLESDPEPAPQPQPPPQPHPLISQALAWAVADMRSSRQPHELVEIPDKEALQAAMLHFAAVQAEVDAAVSSGSATAIFEARARLQEASRALKKANGIIDSEPEGWKPKSDYEDNLFPSD